jgi:hypothetical protein
MVVNHNSLMTLKLVYKLRDSHPSDCHLAPQERGGLIHLPESSETDSLGYMNSPPTIMNFKNSVNRIFTFIATMP